MTHVRRLFSKLTKNKWLLATVVVVALLILYSITRGSKGAVFESVLVTRGNVIEKVSVTGAVSPMSKADLAFKKSGVITRVMFKVGDSVKKGDLIASIDDSADLANLYSAQAQLDELTRGLRPEEYNLYKSNLDTASTTLTNAKNNAISAILDAYIKAQSSVVNYADTFFTSPQSVNPRISITTQSPSIQDSINSARVLVSDVLSKWKSDNDTVNSKISSDPALLISKVENYINTIKTFMSDLSVVVNRLNTGNSGMSQSAIDSAVTTMSTGLSTLSSAINSINSADTTLKNAISTHAQASNQFGLQLAGSSADVVNAQAAKVLAAQAIVNDDRIISPIDGLVTKADPNIGEFVTAGQSGFAVQNNSGYKIEAFVPEADIAKIALKDGATVTLDAYGSYVFFPATVVSVDPAETILQGVPTYKVTLYFDKSDSRIRSGMTANTDIMTHEVDNVILVPSRAIVDDNGKKSVRVVNSDNKTFKSVPVVVGLKGSDGTSEIISGLSMGQKVVTYVK